MRTVLHDEVDDVRRSDGASHVEGRILAHAPDVFTQNHRTRYCASVLRPRRQNFETIRRLLPCELAVVLLRVVYMHSRTARPPAI